MAHFIHRHNDFSLLLLTVSSLRNRGSKRFFVGVHNDQVETLISKSIITVKDFENEDIIHGFTSNEELSDRDIESTKYFFIHHFIPNLIMKNNFKLKIDQK